MIAYNYIKEDHELHDAWIDCTVEIIAKEFKFRP